MFHTIAVAIRSDAVLPRKAVPANGSGKSAGAGNGYRENGYSQCENALGDQPRSTAKAQYHARTGTATANAPASS
ncbi:conserved protein of unknown function [Desulfovibrio sp. 86]|nr:conserved protein of unknown function [Desulfovibrio sp. 86]